MSSIRTELRQHVTPPPKISCKLTSTINTSLTYSLFHNSLAVFQYTVGNYVTHVTFRNIKIYKHKKCTYTHIQTYKQTDLQNTHIQTHKHTNIQSQKTYKHTHILTTHMQHTNLQTFAHTNIQIKVPYNPEVVPLLNQYIQINKQASKTF